MFYIGCSGILWTSGKTRTTRATGKKQCNIVCAVGHSCDRGIKVGLVNKLVQCYPRFEEAGTYGISWLLFCRCVCLIFYVLHFSGGKWSRWFARSTRKRRKDGKNLFFPAGHFKLHLASLQLSFMSRSSSFPNRDCQDHRELWDRKDTQGNQ